MTNILSAREIGTSPDDVVLILSLPVVVASFVIFFSSSLIIFFAISISVASSSWRNASVALSAFGAVLVPLYSLV